MGGLYRRDYAEMEAFFLGHGDYDLVFSRGYTPKYVVVHVGNEFGLPVCQGELNWVSTTITPDGFILHAKIRTNEALVIWATLTDNLVTFDVVDGPFPTVDGKVVDVTIPTDAQL